MELLRDEYFGNSLQTWLIAVGLTIVIYFTALAVKSVVVHRLQIISNKTKNQWDDFGVSLIQKTRRYFLLALAALIGSQVLNFDISITRYFNPSIIILLLIQVWVWGNSSLNLFVEHLISKDRELQGSEEAIEGTMPAILFLGRLVLLSIVVLLALDNFGFNIRTLVASLGVGGIAVALAVQNILGDLFASLSIVLDKPFRVGDFVVVGDLSGNVEKIGLKTTRVRSLSGEQLVFANNDLLSSRIRNYKQMAERRVVFSLGVVYQTSKDKVMKVPGIIEEIVQNIDQTRFDRAHFFNFGASSLDFEVVYFVKSSDYKLYMDIQQKINSGILDAFEKEGIEFAYPTQTLFVEKGGLVMISKVSDLENLIREVPDFPKPGIVYKDITPLLENSEALKFTIHSLAEMVKTLNIQKVIGIESRGFILGSALAVEIGAGLVLVRKAGKLPHQKIVHSYDLEYGSDQVEVHEDAVRPGERVLIVDDVLATGGTASACLELMKKLKADVLGSCFLIELKFLGARTRFSGLKVHSLLSYQ